MDYLNPHFDEPVAWLERLRQELRNPFFPPSVASAMNIFRHEKIEGWKSQKWFWADPPKYDREAKQIAKGHLDRKKQDALYVCIGKNGEVTGLPSKVTREMVDEVLDKTDRLRSVVSCIRSGHTGALIKFEEFKNILKRLFS